MFSVIQNEKVALKKKYKIKLQLGSIYKNFILNRFYLIQLSGLHSLK